MTEEEGKYTGGRTAGKQSLGRSFITAKGGHEGKSGAHKTEWAAEKNLAKDIPDNPVSDTEWSILKEDWGSTIKTLQQSRTDEGLPPYTKNEIRDIIDNDFARN